MARFNDMGFGPVMMHKRDTVVGANCGHKPFAIPHYTVAYGFLQVAGFDTDLPSGKGL